MSGTETIDRLYLELSNITSARSRRELRLYNALRRMVTTQDAWKLDMEQRPEMRPGEVLRLSYAEMREAYHDACRILTEEGT